MAERTVLRPTSIDALRDAIADAAREGGRLEIRGGGSKVELGAPKPEAALLDMGAFSGVIAFDPGELVLTVGAGTPLAEVEALVAEQEQMLAFEPFDHGPIFGRPAGGASIGGVVAAGVAGSQRVSQGGARDHLLGFEAVSGRAEFFVGGAKVVKNVTGYDLPKVVAGSWGRLAAMTQVTIKVLPRPRAIETLIIEGLDPAQACAAMSKAMGSYLNISAAAHVPGDPSITALRIQGFGRSVAARCEMFGKVVSGFGEVRPFSLGDAEAFWAALRTLAPLDDGRPLWRINAPPSAGCVIVEGLEPLGARWMLDWAGGLVWLSFDGDPAVVRKTAASVGGHAILMRAPEAMRGRVPALHPQGAGVAALEQRIRRAFDPAGVFETGRFLDAVHAD